MIVRIASLALLASVGACGAAAVDSAVADANSAMEILQRDAPRTRVDADLKAMGPAGWHRIALYGNWDFTEPQVWTWIVSQPDCDKATALAIFWKASPEYYLQYADRSQARPAELDTYDLIALIRERWRAGAYTHAEFAFDPDTDAWPLDRAALARQYGARVDRDLPTDMRIKLPGRPVPDEGPPLPGVFRS